MEKSRFIASLAGPTMMALGLSMFLNRGLLPEMTEQLSKSYALILIAGLITLVAGLAIVQVHNVWSGGWPIAITLIGWLLILGGLLRILFPREMAHIASNFSHSESLLLAASAGLVAMGAYLTSKGIGRGL